MISDEVNAILESLGLMLERIEFSSLSAHVTVGVADSRGSRWLGRSKSTPHDPADGLGKALENALNQFNPQWKELVEKPAPAM